MKIAVVYNSLTGCTKKVAEAIYQGYPGEKEIHTISEKPSLDGVDIVAVGYWVDKGGPNPEAQSFIESLRDKRVFVFDTLAYYADSDHGFNSVWQTVESLKANGNEVIGHFVANGALAPAVIERFKQMAKSGENNSHAFTPEKGIRYEVLKNNPTDLECALASERFNQRVEIQRRILALAK